MNSKDSYVNLRLMNFVSLLINLRDSLLSLQNDDTYFLQETFFFSYFLSFSKTVINYIHANKGFLLLLLGSKICHLRL